MAPKARVSQFRFINTDVDQVRENLPSTRECVEVQPLSKSKTISMESRQFAIGNFDIWKTDCATGVEAKFRTPPDCYSIYLPLSGSLEVRCRGIDLTSRPGTILIGELPETEIMRKHDKRSHIAMSFHRGEVRKQLHEMLETPVSRDIDLAIEIPDTTEIYQRLTAIGHLLWTSLSLRSSESVPVHSSERLFRAILASLLEDLPHRYSDALARPVAAAVPWQVKRAIDYMVANAGQPLQAKDIAQAAGVSVRALQIAFQRFKDTTPLDFLRRLRLEGAHRALLTPGAGPIADVAKDWGFAHMGRFSDLYKTAFGELPSETRRSANGN
nr:helix-turn-helix transcriptional regulator [uncultured Shinella sp.]